MVMPGTSVVELDARYVIRNEPPSLEDYRTICEAVGWGAVMNFAAAEASLQASLHHVTVVQDETVVAMGRIVGDGHIYFYIQDVAVLPDHQGHGVGRAVIDRLVGYVRANAPERAFIGLFAAPGTEHLYERFGFLRHGGLVGMFQTVPARPPR